MMLTNALYLLQAGSIESKDAAAVFRIEPAKVLAFAKDPHGQTRYRY